MKNRNQIVLLVVLVFFILVVINLIGIRVFTRIDLTESKIFTLSPASKNLVKSLDDKFLVKAYFTADLPAPYNNNRRYLQDQLDEYRAYGGGNFQYEIIDPSTEELEQEAQRYRIPPVQVQVVKEDKLQVEKAYMGLVFLYGDKQEQLPVVQTTANLEYEISSTIKKMTSKELKKIGFLTGHGEPDLESIKRLREMLAKQYEVTTVDISSGQSIPFDISVLVIMAPNKPFKSWEKFLIDQYLMKGGKIAFFLNRINATLQNQMAAGLKIEMDDLLESYGVRINADLVRDVKCAMITIQQQAGFFMIQNQIPFAYLPMAMTFSKTSPIVKDMGAIIFFFASSIDTSIASSKNLNLDVLVSSSAKSGRQSVENFFPINPTAQMTPDQFTESGIPLAVTLEGIFTSHFSEKEVVLDSTVQSRIDTAGRLSKSVATKIAVVGDGDFCQDQYSGGNKDNIIFASNLIDWLADDIGLASIRSREAGAKPLEEVSEGAKSFVKGINLALPPMLVVLVGILRWRWRVAMRKKLESREL